MRSFATLASFVFKKMLDNDLTQLVIQEAMKIHNNLGPGLLESVYESCLAYKLNEIGLFVERQKPIPVIFEGQKMDCGFRADLIINNRIIIEVKAIEALADIHKAQVLTYLKITNLRIGLLMNFNVNLLKDGLKRIINGYEPQSPQRPRR